MTTRHPGPEEFGFDVVPSSTGLWEVRFTGTDHVAGVVTQDADGFHVHDGLDAHLGVFPTLDRALTRLYGND
ncbi:hypothetical protein ACL9RL_03260 [Plantibacter sp. Mn2098]|uniref:hypothetical protein n=1 Tax=Plantibacter sp. Mn2098 TaxID=3395266 RepID=UPI003BBEB107